MLVRVFREVYDREEASVRSLTYILLLFSALVLLATPSVTSQTKPPRTPQHTGDLSQESPDQDETHDRMMHDLEKKAAKDRIAALKTDTDKLLKLSVELKAYVDKSDENVLSLDVIKKADEIEKLARSVKDKMKGPN